MQRFTTTCLQIVLLSLVCNEAFGHGTPINAYVQAATGQLAVFDGYEPGELESFGGSDIFTDAPGIGISSPVNGFPVGESLHLNVVQGLLFWDGISVASTAETLIVDWPDDGGTTNVDAYHVTAESGYQTGMLWGIYQPSGGSGSWDAHGDYALESPAPAAGIYGLFLQLASPSNISSESFLLPLVYDPTAALSATKIAEGIAELQLAVSPLPTADFNRDVSVDAFDLEIWRSAFGASSVAQVEGDATADGIVSGSDYLAWQTQSSVSVVPPLGSLIRVIPEPSTFIVAAVSLSCLLIFQFKL